jgi:hypothetical protein
MAGSNPKVSKTYAFRFDRAYRLAALAFGVTPRTAHVVVSDDELVASFGPWRLRTPLTNIVGSEQTGGFQRIKTMGPPHLSFTDRGLTFATNSDRGLCIRFRDPVGGIDPTHRIRHPGLTVTVSDIDGLQEAVTPAR